MYRGLVAALLVAASTAFGSPRSARADGAWLDQQPLPVWNQAGQSVPKAVPPAAPGAINPRCLEAPRQPASGEERQVAAAGWRLTGEPRVGPGIAVVGGNTDFDGMCRPLAYQAFVFLDGVYAGTLSPFLMNSRDDGILSEALLSETDRPRARFARYRPSDPLCCPSALSEVRYEVERTKAGPRLLAVAASTGPTAQPSAAADSQRSTALGALIRLDAAAEPGRITARAVGFGR
jgi:hypothetical protein